MSQYGTQPHLVSITALWHVHSCSLPTTFCSSSSPLTQSLAEIQYFQAPASDPFTYFSAPTTYFVAVVGDATDAAAPASLADGAANPAFDGHGLHVIPYPETGN